MDDEMTGKVVEHTVAYLRASLNNILRGRKYDADKHNLCIAVVEYADGRSDTFAAYSNDSALSGNFPGIFDFLGLVPNTYPLLKEDLAKSGKADLTPFGCDGMAQYHTEPKLMNFLASSPAVRQRALKAQRKPLGDSYRRKDVSEADLNQLNGILDRQLDTAMRHAGQLPGIDAIVQVTLASEIDCCKTCMKHTIDKFNARYPSARIQHDKTLFELGKTAGSPTPFKHTQIKGMT